MFRNAYITRLKVAVGDGATMFWTWVFPILLATLFFFAFSNLESSSRFNPVKTAVVDDSAYQENALFKDTLEAVSREGDDRLLELRTVDSAAEADRLLESGEITGYITVDGGPRLTVKEEGLDQTVLKSFLDQYLQRASSVENLVRLNPQAIRDGTLEGLSQPKSLLREVSLSQSKVSESANYFYALLAMVCMYGAFQGMTSAVQLQANLSSLGARRSLAPEKKLRLVVPDVLGGFTIQMVCSLLVLAYVALVLRVDFGGQVGYVILNTVVGSLMGVTLGLLVGAAFKVKEEVKIVILIIVSLGCCYMAGLMVGGTNYLIQQNLPLLAWLNPAARIADAYYCLYYFDNYSRYFTDIGILCAMAAVFSIAATFFLRRQKYESI